MKPISHDTRALMAAIIANGYVVRSSEWAAPRVENIVKEVDDLIRALGYKVVDPV